MLLTKIQIKTEMNENNIFTLILCNECYFIFNFQIELANRLMPCFLSPSGIPYSDVNLSAMLAHAPKWSPDSSTSEVSTIQMEFRDLSRLTNISLYERVITIK